MKKEVEILVEILDKKEEAITKLQDFKFLGDKKTLDIYFFDPKKDDLKPDERGQLKNCLRVRSKDNQSSIAYKVDHFDDSGVWLYSDEYETDIEKAEKMIEILDNLGFEELIRIENTKSTFVTDKYEIVLEDVLDLGIFMEVERHEVGDDEDIIQVKSEIWTWLKKIGINVSLELTMGKPELMLRKKQVKL